MDLLNEKKKGKKLLGSELAAKMGHFVPYVAN
jgi:hypothetical protein